MQIFRAVTLCMFGLACIGLAGCGDGMTEVAGNVKVDGKTVDDGAIAFYPADGKGPSAGGPIKNGQYSARVPLGAMKVTISWPKGTGIKKKLYENDPKSAVRELRSESLPERFSDAIKTELTYEVKSGANRKDWDLKN
jgi:hypothetical protein